MSPRIKGLSHVGIAVEQIDEVARVLCEVLGTTEAGREELIDDGLRVVSIAAGNTHLELFEPTRLDGSVARFIAQRGNALHHVSLEVEDLAAEIERLKAAGVRLIDEQPRTGAYGIQVAFVHPKATGGILIELSQKPAG